MLRRLVRRRSQLVVAEGHRESVHDDVMIWIVFVAEHLLLVDGCGADCWVEVCVVGSKRRSGEAVLDSQEVKRRTCGFVGGGDGLSVRLDAWT